MIDHARMNDLIPEHNADDPMIRSCLVYEADGRRRGDITVDTISEVLAVDDGSFVWVGLYEPDSPLLLKLQEEFELHPLAIEDAAKAHQRPKIESYGDSLFIVLHTAQTVQGHIEFGETHIFVGARYLVTVRHGASVPYAPARERCQCNPQLLSYGPSYGLYAVLDYAVDNYFPIVNEFEAELEELEKTIFDAEFKKETVQRLYDLKRDLTRMRQAAAPLQDLLNQLIHFHPKLIRKETRVYFRDVFDHAVRVTEATDTIREMLTAAMSVNLAMVTAQQGEVVKRLAGWAALLAAPTLIASWYGMNFKHMPEVAGKYSYWILIGSVVLICGGLYAWLKRSKWL